jgi:peptidoglycan hydrolase-like protein with peptidoglycan-binding domain
MKKLLLPLLAAAVLLSANVLAQSTSTSSTSGPSTTSSSSTSTTKRGPVFRPTKDQISQVQKILKDKKLYTAEPSGKYDDATRTGIKSFQKDNGLKETGTLNRATLEKFGVELTDAQKAIPVSPNSFAKPDEPSKPKPETKNQKATTKNESSSKTIFRATSDQIKAAQKTLKDKSMYSGEQTGKLDDATRDGLKKYQDGNGLKVTGTLNQATLEKMGIALTDKQKATTPTDTNK